jgi:SNARE associated Golgi protein
VVSTPLSVAAFAAGRWLGLHYVQHLVSPDVWRKLGFIVEAEGVILCFVVFLLPGLPKDITCYLFGLSPMPFWVFAVVSTLGRLPSTWVLSAQGARTASGDYIHLMLITALFVAIALPLYYYRNCLVEWFRAKQVRPNRGAEMAIRRGFTSARALLPCALPDVNVRISQVRGLVDSHATNNASSRRRIPP